VKTPTRLAAPQSILNSRLMIMAFAALVLAFGGFSPKTLAAPGSSSFPATVLAQNVDWMSADTAASLDLPMDVLVPSWIPAPFDSVAPSITASGGYYELYWMIPGGPPTFLYIEGTAGGGMPAGSPANLNNELTINASVQGWNAIHDIGIPAGSDTPIYDQVWWIANGVLYTVSSNNMTGTDTMSLAESLVVLQAPAAVDPTPPVPTEPPYEEPAAPSTDDETSAPVEDDTTVLDDAGTVDETAAADSSVEDAPVVETDSGDTGSSGTSGGDQPWSPGRYDSAVPSDGTNGPRPPVIGTDGTGGAFDTALPNIFFRP